jgi:hypothetical protein
VAVAQTNQPSGWQVLYQQNFENGTPPEWNLSATAGPGTGWSLNTEPGNTYLSATGHVTASLNLGPWTDFSFKARVRRFRNVLPQQRRWNLLAIDDGTLAARACP